MIIKHRPGVQIKNGIDGACSTHGGEERCVQGFGDRPERKIPFGRLMRKFEGNIKKDLMCG